MNRGGNDVRVFGYPHAAGTTDQVITVEHGDVVNLGSESPAMGGYPRQKIFMTSAIQRPGNSGGPIAAADGRVVGLVIEHTRGGVERAGAQGVERGESSSESSPFYHGIPAGEVVRAIAETGFNDLVVLEDPA